MALCRRRQPATGKAAAAVSREAVGLSPALSNTLKRCQRGPPSYGTFSMFTLSTLRGHHQECGERAARGGRGSAAVLLRLRLVHAQAAAPLGGGEGWLFCVLIWVPVAT